MKKILYLILGIGFILTGLMYMLGSISQETSLSTPVYLSPPDTRGNTSDLLGPSLFGIGIFFLTKTRERKKGQIAMEFMMTYGWAILGAIISIGVLSLLGVFNSEQFIASSAAVTPPFHLNAWNVQERTGDSNSPSGVVLELRNNEDQSFELINIIIEGESGAWSGPPCEYTSPIIPIGYGESIVITIPCEAEGGVVIRGEGDIGLGPASSPVLTAGDSFKGDITITYKLPGGNIDLTSTGNIMDTVIP